MNEIKYYGYYLSEYLKLANKISSIRYYEEGVTGISYDKAPGQNTMSQDAKIVEASEKIEKLENQKEYCKQKIKEIEKTIDSLGKEQQIYAIEHYINHKTIDAIAEESEVNKATVRKVLKT